MISPECKKGRSAREQRLKSHIQGFNPSERKRLKESSEKREMERSPRAETRNRHGDREREREKLERKRTSDKGRPRFDSGLSKPKNESPTRASPKHSDTSFKGRDRRERGRPSGDSAAVRFAKGYRESIAPSYQNLGACSILLSASVKLDISVSCYHIRPLCPKYNAPNGSIPFKARRRTWRAQENYGKLHKDWYKVDRSGIPSFRLIYMEASWKPQMYFSYPVILLRWFSTILLVLQEQTLFFVLQQR